MKLFPAHCTFQLYKLAVAVAIVFLWYVIIKVQLLPTQKSDMEGIPNGIYFVQLVDAVYIFPSCVERVKNIEYPLKKFRIRDIIN